MLLQTYRLITHMVFYTAAIARDKLDHVVNVGATERFRQHLIDFDIDNPSSPPLREPETESRSATPGITIQNPIPRKRLRSANTASSTPVRIPRSGLRNPVHLRKVSNRASSASSVQVILAKREAQTMTPNSSGYHPHCRCVVELYIRFLGGAYTWRFFSGDWVQYEVLVKWEGRTHAQSTWLPLARVKQLCRAFDDWDALLTELPLKPPDQQRNVMTALQRLDEEEWLAMPRFKGVILMTES